jgi:F-type H+-transporting ATPase subunit epsilon
MVENRGDVRCAIITPDRQVVDVQVDSVVLPAHDGQVGVLRGRAPLLCKLGIGVLKLTSGAPGSERRFFIDGGFAQVRENAVTVLTQAALEPQQINLDAAEKALAAALDMKIPDKAAYTARDKAIARARTQIALASR